MDGIDGRAGVAFLAWHGVGQLSGERPLSRKCWSSRRGTSGRDRRWENNDSHRDQNTPGVRAVLIHEALLAQQGVEDDELP